MAWARASALRFLLSIEGRLIRKFTHREVSRLTIRFLEYIALRL